MLRVGLAPVCLRLKLSLELDTTQRELTRVPLGRHNLDLYRACTALKILKIIIPNTQIMISNNLNATLLLR